MKNSLGLYIHIPFCVKKCSYCDFPSYAGCETFFEKYADALLLEAEKYKGARVDTVFIGGGTPTSFPPRLLEKILTGINRCFDISDGAEFSVEANPGTVSAEKLSALKNGGVNRLSVGVQSFNDTELKILGRIHDAKTALQTVSLAQKYFDNINIDIMTALPGQTPESLKKNLETATSVGVEHLSCYSLIIEEGTQFFDLYTKGELQLCSEDDDRAMFEDLCSYLKSKGFERYEISNFAKPGRRCRHNLRYWNTEDYIGIGAAAHSCMDGKRFFNSSDLDAYISAPGVPAEIIELTEDDRMGEYVMMALRTSDGVSFEEFLHRFGRSFEEVFTKEFNRFRATDLVTVTDKSFALTEKGFDVSNGIMCEFI